MALFERPAEPLPSLRSVGGVLDRHAWTNGVAAFLLAITGPFAILLDVGIAGGMSPRDISSWMFGAFAFGGALSIVFSVLYRMPMGMAWTIPGVVLLGGGLEHFSFAECVSAFYAAALVILALGVTGWGRWFSAVVPLNVVMAMVAGVFLPFVLKIVAAFTFDWPVATVTVACFVWLSWRGRAGLGIPPILGALVAGGLAVGFTGEFALAGLPRLEVVAPILYRPVLSWPAIGELALPLAVTVVGIHNMQGFAIARDNGYAPPVNVLTTACGLGSLAFALVGAVSTCVTGPANAVLNTSGARERRYAGGVVFGLLMVLFGVFAPFTAEVALALPAPFIGLIGGLALFHVLRGTFHSAFAGSGSVGAMVAFTVTVADVPIASVGAPFWALVLGALAHYAFDRRGGGDAASGSR